MPHKQTLTHGSDGAEYRFKIDAYSPATMPMSRLAQYMAELSQILGEHSAVHFQKLARGSTVLISKVDREAAPKVRDRVIALRRGDESKDVRAAYDKINNLLRADNALGILKEQNVARGVVIKFPGREEFPPIRQQGAIHGIVIGIKGKDETVSVTLQCDRRVVSGIYTSKTIAKELGVRLFEPVRLFGRGRWARGVEGNWNLLDFKIESFDSLIEVPLSDALADIRSIPTEWDDAAYSELAFMRHGPKDKLSGGH